MAARTVANITLIAKKCGDVLEIDKASVDGFSRSVRVRVKVDLLKLVKRGTKLEISNSSIWVPFKYERLPSFCYICGLMGHMKRECDLPDEDSDIVTLPEDKLPFGEWLRASLVRKASVATEPRKASVGAPSLRKQLFENFRKKIQENELDEEDDGRDSKCKDQGNTMEIEEVSSGVKKVTVGDSAQNGLNSTPQKIHGELEQSKTSQMDSHSQLPNIYTQNPQLIAITPDPPTTPHPPYLPKPNPKTSV
ncbi:hypothetical protein ACS0TY_002761 [Phlomoides rotata]